MNTARRLALGIAASPALLVAAALPAHAATGNGHFINSATSVHQSGASLIASFKEAGLGAGSVETITTTATASTTYECVNGGGKNPSASNKHSFTTLPHTSGTFTADKNGNVVSSETLNPPSAADVHFSCPSGQQVTFVSVAWSNLTIKDSTSGASTSFSGSWSYSDPTAPAVR